MARTLNISKVQVWLPNWRIRGFVSDVEDVGMVGYIYFGVGIWRLVVVVGDVCRVGVVPCDG